MVRIEFGQPASMANSAKKSKPSPNRVRTGLDFRVILLSPNQDKLKVRTGLELRVILLGPNRFGVLSYTFRSEPSDSAICCLESETSLGSESQRFGLFT